MSQKIGGGGVGVAHVSCQGGGGGTFEWSRNIFNGEGRVDTMEDTMNYFIVNNHSITTKMNSSLRSKRRAKQSLSRLKDYHFRE